MIQEYAKANIVLFSTRQIADIFVVWARTFSVVLITIVFCRYAIFKVGKKLNKKTTNKLADMNQKLYLPKCYRQSFFQIHGELRNFFNSSIPKLFFKIID